MIRKSEEMMREIKESMRGGQGHVELVHLFKPGEFAGRARLLARLTLETGCSIGLHEHAGEEEIFYIISGNALIRESEADPGKMIGPGDATLTVSGGAHSIANPAAEPLVLLAIIILLA